MNELPGVATRSPPLANGRDSHRDAAHLARGVFALGSVVLATIMFFVVVGTLEDGMISAVVVLTIMLTVVPTIARTAEGRKRG